MTTCSWTGGECYYGQSDDDTCSHTGSVCYYEVFPGPESPAEAVPGDEGG